MRALHEHEIRDVIVVGPPGPLREATVLLLGTVGWIETVTVVPNLVRAEPMVRGEGRPLVLRLGPLVPGELARVKAENPNLALLVLARDAMTRTIALQQGADAALIEGAHADQLLLALELLAR